MSTAADQHLDRFVCRKHRGEIAVAGGPIYEDALVYAGQAAGPSGQATGYRGYLVAEPKRHAAGWEDLTNQEAEALGRLLSRLCGALRATEGAEHVYLADLGDPVLHMHVHLLPRYLGHAHSSHRLEQQRRAPARRQTHQHLPHGIGLGHRRGEGIGVQVGNRSREAPRILSGTRRQAICRLTHACILSVDLLRSEQVELSGEIRTPSCRPGFHHRLLAPAR